MSDNKNSYGGESFHFDPKAESRLRRKLDLMLVPTVSVLYLFCFIDRANIGMSTLLLYLLKVHS